MILYNDPMVLVAKNRGTVRLADGRLATLTYWPIPKALRTNQADRPWRARVQFDNGAYLSVPPEQIVEVVTRPKGWNVA